MPAISSRSHPAIQRFRAARDGKDAKSIFVEGPRLADELLASGLPVREFLYTAAAAEKPDFAARLEALQARPAAGFLLTRSTMEFVSDLDSPPGLILRADRPDAAPWSAASEIFDALAPLVVVLDGLQSPANVGAVLRAAEAAGASGAVTLPGTADPFGPKALRGSAGSAFRVRLAAASSQDSVLAVLREKNIPAYLADARGGLDFWDQNWRGGAALILGPERGTTGWPGVEKIRIPMSGKVESLNVAVAAGILLMEAGRQRRSA